MPWHVVRSGSGYRVKNKKTGKTYSKRPQTKEKAEAQMRAMYANTNESLADRLNKIVIGEWDSNQPHVGWDEALRLCHGNEGMAYLLYGTLKGIKQGKDPQLAFNAAVENENFHGNRPDIVATRHRIADILTRNFGIHVTATADTPDPDLEYDRQREEGPAFVYRPRRPKMDMDTPDPDLEYDRQREEGLMGEDIDDVHDIRAEAFRIAEEAHKTGDESYVKELCREAAARFRITMAEMYRMAEAMYNQHFAAGY